MDILPGAWSLLPREKASKKVDVCVFGIAVLRLFGLAVVFGDFDNSGSFEVLCQGGSGVWAEREGSEFKHRANGGDV